MRILFCILLVLLFNSCSDITHEVSEKQKPIFVSLQHKDTHIDFKNDLIENDSINYFTYPSMYMGGGVSVGDINNDGLKDVFFIGNQKQNKLYLNLGGLQFKDITQKALIGGDHRWYTGATMVDINNDGFLDIYCTVSGLDKSKMSNQLFINNGDQSFTEASKTYGINDSGNSVQATFFDYDKDGDLDLYVANYPSYNPKTPLLTLSDKIKKANLEESDHLYRNDGTTFTDVTKEAQVANYGYSLAVVAADVNNDGWQDLYVSNDYSIPDYFYINNQDGTFSEVIKKATRHTAFYGMGVDISDFNNDGLLDIFQVDMDAQNNRRSKANMASMNPLQFWETIRVGFHHQYMHNCLQLNTGIQENTIPQFSNISRLSGISSTDWSWGPLLADFDNDGFKDLFVTNGTRREVNNKDVFKKLNTPQYGNLSALEKTEMLPVEKIDNFMYQNTGDLTFKKVNKLWGIEYKGFSHGASYADLDNDGDLDLVVNNMDDYASIYKNTSSDDNNFVIIKFKGEEKNKFGIGNRVYIKIGDQIQMQELTLSRGFQSSIAPELHFGIKDNTGIDEIKVVWSNGKQQILKNQKVNAIYTLSYEDAEADVVEPKVVPTYFKDATKQFLSFKHVENQYDDYKTQVLLPHKMSTLGPVLAVADVNGDKKEDYFIGGSLSSPGALFIQTEEGFIKIENAIFIEDKKYEDQGALFFDADQDGDQDLYVSSGGYELSSKSPRLQDRLYVNDGNGNFSACNSCLPKILASASRVYNIDFDKDGKQDLLVLGRQVPGKYPSPANSYVLKNASEANNIAFKDVTSQICEPLHHLGMATSAVVTDIDQDGWDDFIVVGEWMPIRVFKNNEGSFTEVSEALGLTDDTTGWWWSIEEGDFDNDGDTDYIIGNNGLNYKYKATAEETFDIYSSDFDNNNKQDIVLSYYNEGKQYPLRGRQCSSEQIPGIKDKFKDYNTFSEATLVDVYSEKKLKHALHYKVKSFASIYLENKEGKLIAKKLPIEAQLSSINQILVNDYDHDGNMDALIAGNLYSSEVETPRNDAGFGLFLKGDGKGDFKALKPSKSGIYIKGDTKDMVEIKVHGGTYVIVAKNNDYLQFLKHETN